MGKHQQIVVVPDLSKHIQYKTLFVGDSHAVIQQSFTKGHCIRCRTLKPVLALAHGPVLKRKTGSIVPLCRDRSRKWPLLPLDNPSFLNDQSYKYALPISGIYSLQIILLQEQSSPTSVCCLLAWSKGVWISQKMHLRGHPSPSSPTPVVTCAPGICSLILPWSSNHLRLSCLPLPSVWAVFLPAQINRTHRGRSVVHFPPSLHEVINSRKKCLFSSHEPCASHMFLM